MTTCLASPPHSRAALTIDASTGEVACAACAPRPRTCADCRGALSECEPGNPATAYCRKCGFPPLVTSAH